MKPATGARWLALAVGLALGPIAVPAALAQDASGPVTVEFVKENPDGDGTWEGTLSGGIEGDLQTILLNADQSQPVWRVAFEAVADAGERSFRAHVGGTLDTDSGQVRMAGVVTEGHLLGASIDWQGQMVDEAASRFQGTIALTPVGGAPDAGAEDEVTARTRAVFEAYSEAHDASHYAEDATFTDMTRPDAPLVGREAIGAMLDGFYGTEGPFAEGRYELRNQLIQGEMVLQEFVYFGRHTGPLGEIPATNREVALNAMSVYRIEDGEIQWARLYYDSNDMLRQLGVLP